MLLETLLWNWSLKQICNNLLIKTKHLLLNLLSSVKTLFQKLFLPLILSGLFLTCQEIEWYFPAIDAGNLLFYWKFFHVYFLTETWASSLETPANVILSKNTRKSWLKSCGLLHHLNTYSRSKKWFHLIFIVFFSSLDSLIYLLSLQYSLSSAVVLYSLLNSFVLPWHLSK